MFFSLSLTCGLLANSDPGKSRHAATCGAYTGSITTAVIWREYIIAE